MATYIKRIAEYTLVAGDINTLSAGVNVDVLLITKRFNDKLVGNLDRSILSFMFDRFTTANVSSSDDVTNVGKAYNLNTGNYGLIVTKGQYANLASAQAALAGTKILYQLATPITTQLPISNLIAEPSGTLYIDNLFSDVDFYDASILVASKVFSGIEKVLKIDKVTGAELDVTSTCTLTTVKDGFTSTALVKGDLVWFALESTGTMIPSLTYSYPLDIKAAVEGNSDAIKQVDNRLDLVRAEVDNAVKQLDTVSVGTTSLTELAQIKSVVDSYGGIAEFIASGASLYQAVVNGDFANGTTGWSVAGGVLSVANKMLTFTSDNTSATPFFEKTNNGQYTSGNKIFIKTRVRITNLNCLSIAFSIRGSITAGTTGSVTISNPTQNQWYDMYAIVTPNGGTGTNLVRLLHQYADAATANGKVMEIDGNVGVFAIPITGTPYENYTADQMNGIVGKYFEGLQGAKDVVVGSRGRNLFDKDKATPNNYVDIVTGSLMAETSAYSSEYISVKPNTTYKNNIGGVGGSTKGVAYYTKDKKFISGATQGGAGLPTFSTPANARYLRFTTKEGTSTSLDAIMLNEGTSALPYEAGSFSQVTVSATRHKLPNGIEDTISFG